MKRPIRNEADLYAPVKEFLVAQGYEVKGEVQGCDVVAVRGGEPPLIVELKLAFGLTLLLQGIDRLSLSDRVYLAIATRPRRLAHIRKLCRRVGLGLLFVSSSRVEIIAEPAPYKPRRNAKRALRLLDEHARRRGDPNRGGTTRVKLVTAYRQEALRCAALLARFGTMKLCAMREKDDVPRAASIVQRDYYGWFERIARGTYGLTAAGREGMKAFAPARPESTMRT